MLNFILAQSSAIPEPLTGWLGVVLQAGAFGLVCYIVIFAAPKWFSEFRAEREDIAKQAREERIERDKVFEKVIMAMQDKFEGRNNAIVLAVQNQTSQLTDALKESADKTTKALQDVCHAEAVRDRPGSGGGGRK